MSRKISYYRLDLLSESALSIGAADSVETDHDVVLDSRGLPMIPATSLAGVYRSFFDEDFANRYFGSMIAKDGTTRESLVRVYDATWLGGNDSVAVRDSVSLENKVAAPGLKFDRQIVEHGAMLRTFIEVREVDERAANAFEDMLVAIQSGLLLFGSKTTRGFGRMSVSSCLYRTFDLDEPEDRAAWLDFVMFDDSAWAVQPCEDLSARIKERGAQPNSSQLRITLDLEQRGALSVREYSTEPNRPDFGQLYVRGISAGGEDVPVIPGTSWAGAFRDRYEAFAGEGLAKQLFGFVGKPGDGDDVETQACKSRISLSESIVRDGGWKEITRNSVDRFTGGTKSGALFTMRTYYSGRTQLQIRISLQDQTAPAEELKPLLAVLADLHNGFLSVGGLGAVGHGLFRIVAAQLEVGQAEYEGFLSDLLGESDAEFAQPDLDCVAGKIAQLITPFSDEGDNRE